MPSVEEAIEETVEEAVEEATAESVEAVEEAADGGGAPVIVVEAETPATEELNEALEFAEQIRTIAREEAGNAMRAHEELYPHSSLTYSDVVDIVEEAAPEPEPDTSPPPRDEAPKQEHWLTRNWFGGKK